MKIALIADGLTAACLKQRWHVMEVTPWNYHWVLRYGKPDILLTESAWEGLGRRWKYKIASYPDYPKRSNLALQKIVSFARDRGIPTVFWNKEDCAHYDRFISSAELFEYIFTVDENCVPKYLAQTGGKAKVDTLPFAIESNFHHFSGFNFKTRSANFVGSYSKHVHERRRIWQDMMFQACADTGMPLNIYDRNSDRKSPNYRYPSHPGLTVHPAVPHFTTGDIYRHHLVSLNVNTVENSPTMYSRRLVEIIACGGIAVTNPNPAVERYFDQYCHVITNLEEARELIARLLTFGPSSSDLERARAGAEDVRERHTWTHRMELLRTKVGLR